MGLILAPLGKQSHLYTSAYWNRVTFQLLKARNWEATFAVASITEGRQRSLNIQVTNRTVPVDVTTVTNMFSTRVAHVELQDMLATRIGLWPDHFDLELEAASVAACSIS